MGVREAIDQLNAVLRSEAVPQDEVLTVVATAFSRGKMTEREVVYFESEQQPAIRLTYTRKGDITASADVGLDDRLASLVLTRIRALSAGVPVLWRQVWFSSLPLTGYWRYHDEWQVVPVPEDAPKPDFIMADNPFLIEVRGVATGDSSVDRVRAERRFWELHLILSLALSWVSISANDRSPTHAWVRLGAGEAQRAEYLQRGYLMPSLSVPANDFTPVAAIDPVPTIDEDEYFGRIGISADSLKVEVPALLPTLLDRYAIAAPADKDTFLRACYWLSRSGPPTARLSMSLAYISVISSVEVLVPDAVGDPCPTRGRDRAPGPTARFREVVERYMHGVEGARQLYALRSKLVHGGDILDLDLPAPWGSLDPDTFEQREQYGLARRVATAVIINWFLDA